MSAFVLKIIALLSMLFDHIGYVVFGKISWFNFIGRIAFPIFAFQISEGYIHTKNIYKYFLRLFIFAIISQIPFIYFKYTIGLSFSYNIFFTLLFGLLSIFIYNNIKYKYIGILCTILLSIIAQYFKFDYGAFGVIIIFLFYIFKRNRYLLSFSFVLAVIIKYLVKIFINGFDIFYIIFAICTMSSLIFILLYNNKKGRNIKYLLYFFYPIHFLVLAIIANLIS